MTLWTPPKELHLSPHVPYAAPPPGIIQAKLEIGVWDKRQRLIHQQLEPSRSPVKQLLQILLCQMINVNQAMTDINNSARTITRNIQNLYLVGVANDDTEGLIIGTNGGAVDITNYALAAPIADGSGAGQMLYGATNRDTTVTVADPVCSFDVWRNYNNNSGNSITVAETAVYGEAYAGAGPGVVPFCLFRDTPTAVLVPDGGGCYVKYTLTISE